MENYAEDGDGGHNRTVLVRSDLGQEEDGKHRYYNKTIIGTKKKTEWYFL